MQPFDPHAYTSAFGLAALAQALISVFLAGTADTLRRVDPMRLALKGVACGFFANAMLCGWVWLSR